MNATGLTVSTMPTGLPAAHVELATPQAEAPAPKLPPGVKLFTEKPTSSDARPAGETADAPAEAKPGLAADPGPTPDAPATETTAEAKPAEAAPQDPLEVAAAARDKAVARARAQASRKRQEAEYARQAESERIARLQAEQRARQAEISAQDISRIRDLARSANPQDRAQAIRAMESLGIPLNEIGEAFVAAQTPEGKLQADIANLKAERERDRQQLLALQRDIAERQQMADLTAKQQKFVEEAQQTAKAGEGEQAKYPELAGMSPNFVITLAQDLIQRSIQANTQANLRRGYSYQEAQRLAQETVGSVQNHEILSYLNQENARHRKAAKSTPASQQSPKVNPAPAGATAKPSQPTSRTTVTHADTDEPLSRPQNWDDLSDPEQRKWLAKQLRGKLVIRSEE